MKGYAKNDDDDAKETVEVHGWTKQEMIHKLEERKQAISNIQ